MKNVITKPANSQRVILVVLVTIAVLAIVGGIIYKRTRPSLPKYDKSSLSDPNAKKYSDMAPVTQDTAKKAGTITPAELFKDSQKYFDKEVKLRGLLYKMPNNQYIITDQNTDSPKAFVIYPESSSLNLAQYAVEPSTSATSAGNTVTPTPVTITGVYKTDGVPTKNDTTTSAKFIAKSIEK